MILKKGYITLTTVIVLSAAALLIVTTSLVITADSSTNNEILVQKKEAIVLADACAEYALNQLKLNDSYTGGTNLNIGNGSCEVITVTGSGNNNRIVNAEGYVDDLTVRVLVRVQEINPNTIIDSWTNVDSF